MDFSFADIHMNIGMRSGSVDCAVISMIVIDSWSLV